MIDSGLMNKEDKLDRLGILAKQNIGSSRENWFFPGTFRLNFLLFSVSDFSKPRNLGAIEERKELLTEKICRFDREEKLRVSKEKALTSIFM
ncbi:hypothetical protein Peur_045653 [Populus x canadensis]